MSSRLGRNGAIVRPFPAPRALNSVRGAAIPRIDIDLTEDDAPRPARPYLHNPHAGGLDPLLYVVFAHHHYPWEAYGLGESTDFVGIYATLEEAMIAARGRYHREQRTRDGWEYLWDQVRDGLCLKARIEDEEVDVETLNVTISSGYQGQGSVNHGMGIAYRIGEDDWKEELIRHLGRDLWEELKNEMRESSEEMREELKEEMRNEIDEELRDELKEEMREELNEELREEVKEELREELDEELREELKEELEEEIKEELREELSEKQWVYVLRVEHRVEGEVQGSKIAGVHLDIESAETAARREYMKCCKDVQTEPDVRADRGYANGFVSYELVWEGEGEETWNICLEDQPLQ